MSVQVRFIHYSAVSDLDDVSYATDMSIIYSL